MAHDCDCRHDDVPTILPVGTSRRDLLRFGAAAAGVFALGPLDRFLPRALGGPLTQKRLVVINLYGGNDSLNMLIPHTLQPYYDRRPTIAIAEQDGLALTGPHFNGSHRLHPMMDRIASLWNEGSVAAIHRVGYPNENLSHFTSQDIYSLGVRNGFGPLGVPVSGWIARYADTYAPTAMGAVSVGVGRPKDFDGGQSNPFLVNSLANFQLYGNTNVSRIAHRLDHARDMLEGFQGEGTPQSVKDAIGQAHDLVDEVQEAVGAYTSSASYTTARISRQLKDIAVLIQGGFETQVFFTGYGGFDTHGGQGTTDGSQAPLFEALDDGIGSFVDDCKEMGIWNDTVILVITEFGRRNFENGSAGTDHGGAYTGLVLGGNVTGGVYGTLTEDMLQTNWLSYERDFRAVYKEVIQGHMGVDPSTIFPEGLEAGQDAPLGIV